MKFHYYNLGYVKGGEIVQVNLHGTVANVRLMDGINFNNFKKEKKHVFFGGYGLKSPVRLQIPETGYWYLVVDLGGRSGILKSTVTVLPGNSPEVAMGMGLIASELLSGKGGDDSEQQQIAAVEDDERPREYDLFILYAEEDRDEVVFPLAERLRELGLKVWHDPFQLTTEDTLRNMIERGMAESRYGVIVVSAAFVNRDWTSYALDGIFAGEPRILPIWHNITKKQVIQYSPSFANQLSRNTAISTIEEIAEEIRREIKG